MSHSHALYDSRLIYCGEVLFFFFNFHFPHSVSLFGNYRHSSSLPFFFPTGFVEKEIKKADIPIVDTGENPEVPFPRDMIDLEVLNGLEVIFVLNSQAFLKHDQCRKVKCRTRFMKCIFQSKAHIALVNASTCSEEHAQLM